MSELNNGFQSIPPEYQTIIQLAQDHHRIIVAPLELLVGGRSGAMVYLVSVAWNETKRVEHCILKLDHKSKHAKSDEIMRHNTVINKSMPEFAGLHIAELVFDRVELEGAIAIFYRIAGQSLLKYLPLSSYERESQLKTIFAKTNHVLLKEWNENANVQQTVHPQKILEKWLGFRLDAGGNIEHFLHDICQVDPEVAGLLINGHVFPNPLLYARRLEQWSKARAIDVLTGFIHGDLNTNNILVKFSEDKESLEGFYLIDFALFKEGMPLLYDQRYLEMSYLILAQSKISSAKYFDFLTLLSVADVPDSQKVAIELSGMSAVIGASRDAFSTWLQENHPSLHDDLWGQYWLAGVAAGLTYCHKAGMPKQQRLAGLIYAAANLRRFATVFKLPQPTNVKLLYDESQSEPESHFMPQATKPKHNLPVQPTSFIGRAVQLNDLKELILKPDVHLVTLVGPGGTGKTRMALETANALLGHFPDGVYFIDLAPVSDPALIVTTTAHTLGIREGGGRPPLENLKSYLSGQRMLLLFDNFEQISSAGSIVTELLSAAPGVKALVTSRNSLQVRGEHEYPVEPLDLPPKQVTSPDQSLEYEAINLFRQRARSVQPDFEITTDNLTAITSICQRLDGLPLAIEIAAVRIKMLTPEALHKRLQQGLNTLVGGARDLPDRQQTLRGTIDWSYNLLDPNVRDLFARLGVFSGGFTLEAAEAVAGVEIDVFTGIETLLNSSLIRRMHSTEEEQRFDMLQTIRDYALEKAKDTDVFSAAHEAHSDYYLKFAGSAELYGEHSMFWLKRLEGEHENLRAALSWMLEQEAFIPAAFMMASLSWFWYRYGHLQEGSEFTEQLLQNTGNLGESPLRAMALFGRAYLGLWSGELNLSVECARQAMEMSERLKFDDGISLAKLVYGVSLVNQGKDKEAYPVLVDAVELFDQLDQSWYKGTTIVHLANVSLGLGNTTQALKWLDTALPIMRETGDIWNLAFALNNYGEVARVMGEYDKAESYYRQTEELFQQADARGDEARLVNTFGYIALHKQDFKKAQKLFCQSLDDFRKLGNQRGIAECLAGLAGVAAEEGKFEWAGVMLNAAESVLRATGGAWWPADRVEVERYRDMIGAALGPQGWTAAQEKGQSMTLEQALAFASM